MTDEPADDTTDNVAVDVEALLRELTADDLVGAEAPPPSVWAGIQARIEVPDDATGQAAPATPVTSLVEHRGRRPVAPRWLVAAAAAIVVTGAVAVVLATSRGDADDRVVATAQLTWDPAAFDPSGADATATAELVRGDDGYELVLTDAELPAQPAADLELWLISTDAEGTITDVQPVSLVDPTSPGTYPVPADLDPDTYTVVDISIEPRDGDESHSGNSILRGELGA